jgi:hypothetical protein
MRGHALELAATTWQEIPWSTDLANVAPPDEPGQTVFVLSPGQGSFASGALGLEGGVTVRLKPGVYRESIRVLNALTVIGDGEGVIWETAVGPCATIDSGALVVKNVTFRAVDVNHDALYAPKGFVRVEGCHFEGGRRPCNFEEGEFQIVGCTFKDCSDSGIGTKRGLWIRDVKMSGLTNVLGQGTGVCMLKGSDACIEFLEVDGAAGNGMIVEGGELRGRGITIRGSQYSAICVVVGSTAYLAGVRIEGCGAGVLVRSGSSLELSGLESDRITKSHVVIEDSRVTMKNAKCRGAKKETAIVVKGASAVKLDEVEVAEAVAALKVIDRAEVSATHLTMANVATLAIEARNAKVTCQGSKLSVRKAPAVLAVEKAEVALVDCDLGRERDVAVRADGGSVRFA